MAGLLAARPFLAASLIFSFLCGGGFARGRTENFLVELEGGSGNKESWQNKIILKSENLSVTCLYIRVVRGEIKFGILRDPLKFLFLIDLYGPYLIEFLI